jgi:hypothetical protein
MFFCSNVAGHSNAQWQEYHFLVIMFFFCFNVASLKDMMMKSWTLHHHALLFQCCRSLKLTTMKSLIFHHHVFFCSNVVGPRDTIVKSRTPHCRVFFAIVLHVLRTQWGGVWLLVVVFFFVQVLEVPRATTTRSWTPCCHLILFQCCRSFKHTTMKSSAPHRLVLKIPVL